jgi:hypothetical protein
MASEKRQDTKLESEGAEFMVLGMLLIEGIHCLHKFRGLRSCRRQSNIGQDGTGSGKEPLGDRLRPIVPDQEFQL